jgi:hypothetical protein
MAREPEGDFNDWVGEQFFVWSPAMISRIKSLGVQAHWLTTWRDQANDILASRFNWEPLPVLERQREALWWKLESLTYAQPYDEPFVWIDDELDERRAGSDGIIDAILERYSAPFLLVCPEPHVGLSSADLDAIEKFLKQ